MPFLIPIAAFAAEALRGPFDVMAPPRAGAPSFGPDARASGAVQEITGLVSGGDLGWLEAYVARFPNRTESKVAATYLARPRPAFNRR